MSLNENICCNAWNDAVAQWIVLLPLNAIIMGSILCRQVTSIEAVYTGEKGGYANIRRSLPWG